MASTEVGRGGRDGGRITVVFCNKCQTEKYRVRRGEYVCLTCDGRVELVNEANLQREARKEARKEARAKRIEGLPVATRVSNDTPWYTLGGKTGLFRYWGGSWNDDGVVLANLNGHRAAFWLDAECTDKIRMALSMDNHSKG